MAEGAGAHSRGGWTGPRALVPVLVLGRCGGGRQPFLPVYGASTRARSQGAFACAACRWWCVWSRYPGEWQTWMDWWVARGSVGWWVGACQRGLAVHCTHNGPRDGITRHGAHSRKR